VTRRILLYLYVFSLLFCLPWLHAQVDDLQAEDADTVSVTFRRLEFHTPIFLSQSARYDLRKGLQSEFAELSKQQWPESLKYTAAELAKEAYQNEGYLEAEVASQVRVMARRGRTRTVDLLFDVNPGKQFRLVGVRWKSMTTFSEDELSKLMPVRPGEIFCRRKIANGLEAVRSLYADRGYINFTSIPISRIDEEAGTLAFEIDVDEGGQFHFGNLDIEGMEEAHRQILASAWEELRGHPYNQKEADKFFNRFFKSPLNGVIPEDYVIRHVDEVDRSVSYALQLLPSLRH
jgi:outer membrane translocation and assembly module TamA